MKDYNSLTRPYLRFLLIFSVFITHSFYILIQHSASSSLTGSAAVLLEHPLISFPPSHHPL